LAVILDQEIEVLQFGNILDVLDNPLTWLYKPVNIHPTLLNLLQQEFIRFYDKFASDLDTNPVQLISDDNINTIPTDYPYIFKYLKLLGIHQHLLRIGVVVMNQPKVVVHTDWPTTGYALNIPVLNCDNTYTAWYNANSTNNKATMFSSESWKSVGDSPLYDTATAVEIDRVDAAAPHWINVHVPHSPICSHNQLRLNGTIRFTEPIYEYLTKLYPN
jgi:hypothetical protein